ncbi:cold-shock protein (plasmid) [Sinorhizobium meliloti]|nr:cold-shock protein [Sinorhizobium meliloti]
MQPDDGSARCVRSHLAVERAGMNSIVEVRSSASSSSRDNKSGKMSAGQLRAA